VAKPGVSVAAPRAALRASKGVQRARLVGGRRFGLGKRRHWRAVCGTGPRFRQKPARSRKGRVGRAARQGASGVWSITSCEAEQAEREDRRETTVSGHGPDGGRSKTGSSWRERRQARCHSRSEGPRGLSAPPWTEDRSRVGKAADEKGRPRKRRSAGCEPCARERGFPRVLVTTDRLQRLVRGIFSPTGGPAHSCAGGTTGSSDIAAAVTVTGRPELRCARRVPEVVDTSDSTV
jgi:hypothetical protein